MRYPISSLAQACINGKLPSLSGCSNRWCPGPLPSRARESVFLSHFSSPNSQNVQQFLQLIFAWKSDGFEHRLAVHRLGRRGSNERRGPFRTHSIQTTFTLNSIFVLSIRFQIFHFVFQCRSARNKRSCRSVIDRTDEHLRVNILPVGTDSFLSLLKVNERTGMSQTRLIE